MASFQERIIETILTDFEQIKTMPADKKQRNECNLLLKRLESAKKLFLDDRETSLRLLDIENRIKVVKQRA